MRSEYRRYGSCLRLSGYVSEVAADPMGLCSTETLSKMRRTHLSDKSNKEGDVPWLVHLSFSSDW